MHRKGFPESYDRRALLQFVSDIKSGVPVIRAPKYSHLYYDILPDEQIEVTTPDVLILEGLNVLAPAGTEGPETSDLTLSDFFDFSIYVDANTKDIQHGTLTGSSPCAPPRLRTRILTLSAMLS